MESKFVGGLRVTDGEALPVVVAVLAGLVNKELVAGINAQGGRAVGLSGADGGLIRARRRPELGFVGDIEGAMRYLRSLPYINGKVGVFGTCSGGRNAFFLACRVKGFDAAVECWGGRVVMPKEDLTPKQPVAPIDYTKDLSCPLLGIFGNEDKSPSPEQVNQHEAELKKHGKNYEFHRYDGAGHGFFYYDRPAYRQEQAVDGWKKIFAFLEKHLSK